MIRSAHSGDAEAIAALWNPYILDTAVTFNAVPRSATELAALISQRQLAGHAFLVAEAEGALQGFASYGPFRSGSGYARTMEHSIFLAPGANGKGLGRALMAALEDHARSAGNRSLIGGISAENPQGQAFHAALGFTEIAILPEVGFKFGRWMDLVLMQKFL